MDGSNLRRLWTAPAPMERPGLSRVLKGVPAGDDRTSPPAVLTYPVVDRQGDWVDPEGIDWAEFRDLGRLTNLEHGPPVGVGAVTKRSVPGPDGEPVTVPVGRTTFFETVADTAGLNLIRYNAAGRPCGLYKPADCVRYAEQTRGMIAGGELEGVSIEFRPAGPKGDAYEPRGPYDPALGRPPFDFRRSVGLGWAHCAVPVNQMAGLLRDGRLPDDSPIRPRAEKAYKRLVEGSLPTFDPEGVIRKALAPFARLIRANPTGRVTAAVRKPIVTATKTRRLTKAEMDDDDAMGYDPPEAVGLTDEPDAAADAAGTSPDQPADDMKPTPGALFQLSQAILDACQLARDLGAKGEHPAGLKMLESDCAAAEALAAKIKAHGDKVLASVGGDGAEDEVADDEPPPPETSEDGEIVDKSFGSWRPKRFTLGDLRPPVRKSNKAMAGGLSEDDAAFLLGKLKQYEVRYGKL